MATASQWIDHLRDLKQTHGDLEILDDDNEPIDLPEFYDPKSDDPDSDDDPAFYVD